MAETLLPALCRGEAPSDRCLVRAVSGRGMPDGAGRVVSWEEERYHVDLGAATAVRLQQVRSRQNANSMDEVLELVDVAASLRQATAAPGAARTDAGRLRDVRLRLKRDRSSLFGHAVPSLKASLDAAEALVASARNSQERRDAARRVLGDADLLLADVLASFAYAMAIGDPDASDLLNGDPALHHWFDAKTGPAAGPWRLPVEVQTVDRSWTVQGSLLALYTVYPRSWLRRLSVQSPGRGPRSEPRDVRGFGETAAAFNAYDLTDAGRDAIVQAIRRGRTLVAELVQTPERLWAKAGEAGVSEWRCRAALWTAAGDRTPRAAPSDGQPQIASFFSLAELLWLGDPGLPQAALDAWGVASRPVDGRLSVRMPQRHAWEDLQGPRGVGLMPTQVADVHLRVAEALFDLDLPAVLAPEIAARATWDVLTAADMTHRDDWFALIRAAQSIPPDEVLDYVSALTAIGPLVPDVQPSGSGGAATKMWRRLRHREAAERAAPAGDDTLHPDLSP
jgi:hypothetical protein